MSESAAAKVTADSGELKAVILREVEKLAAIFLREVLGSVNALSAVDLKTLDAHRSRLLYSLVCFHLKGINDSANRKITHNIYLQNK